MKDDFFMNFAIYKKEVALQPMLKHNLQNIYSRNELCDKFLASQEHPCD